MGKIVGPLIHPAVKEGSKAADCMPYGNGSPLGDSREQTARPPAPAGPEKAFLYLLGPMRLYDSEGRDCTPQGSLMQALLAVLALSPQGKRSRTKLQDLFWSEADPDRAAQNLRTAIVRLRRVLLAQSLDIIAADRLSLRLDLSAVEVDILRYCNGPEGARTLRRDCTGNLPEIAEGLNIRSLFGEEFESWLALERQLWWERLEEIRDGAQTGTPLRDAERPELAPAQPAIGLLPCIARHRSAELDFLADSILEGLATALQDIALVDVHDYRDTSGLSQRQVPGPGPTVLLRVMTEDCGEHLLVTLVTYRSDQAKLLWKWSVEISRSDAVSLEVLRFINEAADRVCDSLAAAIRDGGGRPSPYHALNLMFRFDADSLAAARVMLEEGHSATGDTVYLGLMAYLNSFRVGEHWLDLNEDVHAETQVLVNAILESNPFNSLTLAMTGHASGYILHDYDLAVDLLERATRLNGSLAVCWDHLALNYLYVGRLDEAERASEMAIRLGAFSPLRFTYDCTMCMIRTIRGDYAEAVRFGQRSLARRPNFGAALRYTAVSLSHLGRAEEAHRIVSHIRSLSPDFSSEWVTTNRLAVVDANVKSRLLVGLQKAGA